MIILLCQVTKCISCLAFQKSSGQNKSYDLLGLMRKSESAEINIDCSLASKES